MCIRDRYCTDLTGRAREGKIDRIIGREREIYRTVQILCRRTKNNPCLIGEPGVGKTAIAEGLALRIASGDVPPRLRDKELHLLDLTALVAGTQFRGQFESRIKGLVDEVRAEGNIIPVSYTHLDVYKRQVLITHYMDEAVQAERVVVMDDGHVLMDGAPRDIFSQVERLRAVELDVPQPTELCERLRTAGVPLPDGILTAEECAEALSLVWEGPRNAAD